MGSTIDGSYLPHLLAHCVGRRDLWVALALASLTVRKARLMGGTCLSSSIHPEGTIRGSPLLILSICCAWKERSLYWSCLGYWYTREEGAVAGLRLLQQSPLRKESKTSLWRLPDYSHCARKARPLTRAARTARWMDRTCRSPRIA